MLINANNLAAVNISCTLIESFVEIQLMAVSRAAEEKNNKFNKFINL